MPVPRDVLDEQQDPALPPLQQVYSSPSSPSEGFTVTLYLNTLKPLSEPKWCRTGLIDEWLTDALGVVKTADEDVSSWKGKIEIMDPESVSGTRGCLELTCSPLRCRLFLSSGVRLQQSGP
jgi:20S proteasome subunit alpha 6